MTRVAVILHERLGHWNRQLRPRLHDRPIRWFETRSRADLDSLLIGLACPVVLIDLGRHPIEGLKDLDAHCRSGFRCAQCSCSTRTPTTRLPAWRVSWAPLTSWPGFVPPPIVARLLARWIELARRQLEARRLVANFVPADPDRALGVAGRFSGRFASTS